MRGTLELVSVVNTLAAAGPALLQSTRRCLGRDLCQTKNIFCSCCWEKGFFSSCFHTQLHLKQVNLEHEFDCSSNMFLLPLPVSIPAGSVNVSLTRLHLNFSPFSHLPLLFCQGYLFPVAEEPHGHSALSPMNAGDLATPAG